MFWGLSNLIINSSSNPIQGPKTKLCSSLRESCFYCESSTFLNTKINPFPGIPKLNEYISTISHEYFSEIVDNFIEKQNEIMKSQLNDLRFSFSLLPGPLDLLFNKKPEGIDRINKEIGNFVHCIRKRSQKTLRESLKKIKKTNIKEIVIEVDNLYNKINIARKVSFISLSDVFGELNCLKIFRNVKMCCIIQYLKGESNTPIYQIISNNPTINLRECSNYEKISEDFSKLDEIVSTQNEDVCDGIVGF